MTKSELIKKLAPFSDDIFICVEDWNEGYAPPKILETVCLFENDEYTKDDEGDSTGTFVLLN